MKMTSIELGGNIELVGFQELDNSELIIIKKLIGNYARKFSDALGPDYEKLSISLKKKGTKTLKYETDGTLVVKGKPVNCVCTSANVFMCIADCLKELEIKLNK